MICRDPTNKKRRYVYLGNNVKRGIIDIENLLIMISLLNLKCLNLNINLQSINH